MGAEYGRNGAGFGDGELGRFYQLTDAAYRPVLGRGTTAPLQCAQHLSQSGYGRLNPGRDCFYLRIVQKAPFDNWHFTPVLTLIDNVKERSFSVAPEAVYPRFNNFKLRLRALVVGGGNESEFGQRQNRRRLELMARFYF